MELEELIKDSDLDKERKRLNRALDIASREWENIKCSLELCGDIGEFDKEDFMIGIIEEDVIIRNPLESPTKSVSGDSPTFYPMYLIKNLLVMEDKFSDFNYRTIEASHVFVELATVAANRLDLNGTFAMAFASGYAFVRSGWIAEKGLLVEREIFINRFFKGVKTDYDWDFHLQSIKIRFQEIFQIFKKWQDNPEIYKKEARSKAVVKPFIV